MDTARMAFMFAIAFAFAAAAAQQVPQSQIDTVDTTADRAMALYYMDPWVGTWNLNVEKSKFSPGPPLKGGKARIELYGDGIKCILDPVSADGETRHGEWMAQYDGKDSPAAMEPYADSVSIRKTGSNTLETVYKKQGKRILTEKWTVPRNRKYLIVSQGEENPAGKGFYNILVYEKE